MATRRKAPDPDVGDEFNELENADAVALSAFGLVDGLSADFGLDVAEASVDRVEAMGPREAVPGDAISYEISNAELKSLQAQFVKGELKPEDDWQRVICMRMGRPGQVTASLHGWGPYGLQPLRFTPFAISPLLPPQLVHSITKRRPSRPYGQPIFDYWTEPPKYLVNPKTGEEIEGKKRGTCLNKSSFTDQNTGSRVRTCIYGNCPHHPLPDGLFHSIWMAQKFIAQLKSPTVIQAYIEKFDPRPEVAAFAQAVINHRERSLRDAMGTGSTNNADLTF